MVKKTQHPFFNRLSTLIALTLTASIGGMASDYEPGEDAPIVELDQLIVQAEEDSSGIDRFFETELPRSVPGNLTEKLSELPGIEMTQRGAFSSEPMIRGLGFDRVATVFNGMKLPNGSPTRTQAPVSQFAGIAGRKLHIASFIPSVTLGPPVTGGWIDLEYAPEWSLPEGTSSETENVLVGDWYVDRDGMQLAAFQSFRLRNFGYSASVFRNKLGNYTSGDGREIPSRHEDWGASLSIAGRSGERWVNTLDAAYRKQLFTENASLPLDVENGEFYAISASHEYHLKEHQLKLRYGYAETKSFLTNQRRETRPILVNANTETKVLHADLRWSASHSTLGRIESGIDTNYEKRLAIRERGSVAVDYLWPDIRYAQTGVFFETLTDINSKLSLRSGLRWDHSESKAQQADQLSFGHEIRSLYVNYSGAQAGKLKQTEESLSGNVLLHYLPDQNTSVYTGLGASAQVPPPTERYRTFLSALGGGFEIGNPALKPERKWEFAAGGKWSSDRLVLRLDGYYFQVDDYIWRQQVGTTEGVLPQNPPQTVYSYRNVDAAFTGMELEGTIHLSSRLSIPIALEWVDASLSNSGPGYEKGDQIPELPPMEIRIGAVWNGKIKSIDTSLEWTSRWTDSQKNELPEIDPTYQDSDAYWTHDLYLTMNYTNRFALKLGIRNLFDQEYAPYLAPPVSSIRPSSGELNPGDRIPGEGREAVVSIRFEF